MKKEEVLPYVYDFIRILSGKAAGKIGDIILFGSVARGDFDKDSDIDIFVNVAGEIEKEMRKSVNDALNEFELYSERTWKLHGMDLPIKCVVGDINSPKWSELKREIISSGIVLYGRYNELPQNLKRCFIFSFSFSRLKPGDRARLIRKIYGYSSKKGRKTYQHTGILKELKGERLNPSVVMVPAEGYKKLFDFFRKSRISFRITEVWTG